MLNWREKVVRNVVDHQDLTISGTSTAVNVTNSITILTNTLDGNSTLADGEVGQQKLVVVGTGGHTATITPSNFKGYTSFALANKGAYIALEFDGYEWQVIAKNDCVLA